MTGATGVEAEAQPLATARDSFIFVCDYEQIWDDQGSRAREDGSIWRPKCDRDKYAVFGHVAADDRGKPLGATIAVRPISRTWLNFAQDLRSCGNPSGEGTHAGR